MKDRKPILEITLTAVLALIFGFFLAAGAILDGGGYLGYGVESTAADVFINWLGPEIYFSTLAYALMAFAVLLLLWRALDWIATTRARRLLEQGTLGPAIGSTDHTGHTGNTDDTLSAKHVNKRWFFLGVLLLFVCWLPYWLGVWPGIFNYDAHFQYQMINESNLQTHHPLLHTLLLNGFLFFGQEVLGSFNAGVALMIGFGLVLSALAFSWMLYTMAEEGAGKVLLTCSVLLLINPSFALWLVSTNKDVLFTAVLVLMALMLYRACRFRKGELALAAPGSTDATVNLNLIDSPQRILRIGAGIGFALFLLVLAVLALRTSAVYSFIIFLPLALFLIRKHLRVRLVGIMASATVVFVVVYLLLTQVIFQIPSGAWQTLDALSIPRQQLARVWVQTSSPAEIAAFEALFDKDDLDVLSEYEADNADTSRRAFLAAFREEPEELLALYLEMGAAHPGTYFDAALLTSYEAWYPGAVIDGYVLEGNFSRPGEARGGYLDVSTFSPAEEDWILEGFGEWLREFGLGNVGMDLAPVRLLCSPATYMWLLLVVLVRTICTRNLRGALVCTLLLIFGLTALLSPLVVPRYFLMILAATPLLLHLATSPSWSMRRE